jgi:D-alanyl-D-alanine dipeptidase
MTVSTFGALDGLRRLRIPDQAGAAALKKGYRDHPLDISGPSASEPLVDARHIGLKGENFYASARNPPHYSPIAGAIPELWVRKNVGERLVSVNGRLSKVGLALWLFDGWRPTAVQSYFHGDWMPMQLRARRSDLTDAAVLAEVETYWAAPTVDPAAPSPHLTGGAVDLTLCWHDTNERLWMGSVFDDVSELASLDHFEKVPTDKLSLSNDEARANRRLLYWVMLDAGFSANPAEWWHFSYGDQMWARLTGAPTAFYGTSTPPARIAAREAAA